MRKTSAVLFEHRWQISFYFIHRLANLEFEFTALAIMIVITLLGFLFGDFQIGFLISAANICGTTADIVDSRGKISAPGQLPSHYAPKTPLHLIDNATSISGERTGLLAWNPTNTRQFAAVRQLSPRQDLREAAANLFRYLRELDSLDLDLIVAERVPARGLGAAILDRLQRASHDSGTRGRPE